MKFLKEYKEFHSRYEKRFYINMILALPTFIYLLVALLAFTLAWDFAQFEQTIIISIQYWMTILFLFFVISSFVLTLPQTYINDKFAKSHKEKYGKKEGAKVFLLSQFVAFWTVYVPTFLVLVGIYTIWVFV